MAYKEWDLLEGTPLLGRGGDSSDEEVSFANRNFMGMGLNVKKSVIEIPKFGGANKDDFSEFLETFFRASKLNNWDKKAQALILPSYLSGRAKEFYNTFEDYTKESVNKSLKALDAHFNSSAQRYQARNLAGSRVQNKESVAEFFKAIYELCRKGWASETKGEERKRACELFVGGLRPEIKKIFWNNEPNNIEDALSRAEDREIYIKTKSKFKTYETNTLNERQPDHKSDRSSNKEVDELKIQLQDLKNVLAQQAEVLKGQKADNMKKWEASGDRGDKNDGASKRKGGWGQPKCWSCGSPDHFRADCKNASQN